MSVPAPRLRLPVRFAAPSGIRPGVRVDDAAAERDFWTRSRRALPPSPRSWLTQQARRQAFIERERLSPAEAAFLPPQFDPANPESPRWTEC